MNQVNEKPSCDHDAVSSPPVRSIEVLERAAAILRAAGDPGRLRLLELLSRRREGKHQFYGLADHHVSELVQGVLEHASEEGN